MLDIKGILVTIDAMVCQNKIAKATVEQGDEKLGTHAVALRVIPPLTGTVIQPQGIEQRYNRHLQ